MAKRTRKPPADGEPIAVPDLFALLTLPGRIPVHEAEVTVFAPSLRATASVAASAPEMAPPPAHAETAEQLHPDALLTPVTEGAFPSSIVAIQEPEMKIANDTMTAVHADIAVCTRCGLHATRTNVVPGEGPATARLIFIGEAPGADEDATGRPFVGRAGQHLDKILTAAGFKREEVYICNILKCRPPENRTPTHQEMELCTPFLRRQIALVKPQLIGLLGNTACKFVLGKDSPGITKIRGQWFDTFFGLPCMPMYHPSYLLRNQSRNVGSPNWEMWQDIQSLKKRFDELRG